jgi:succinoglycan biosynthesis transport protein ExoP
MKDDFNASPAARKPLFDDSASTVRAAHDGGYANQEHRASVHLSDYIKVLYKRRWTALTAFVVVVVTVTTYTLTAIPMYQAKVQILIEKEHSNVVNFKEAFDQNQITDDYYQTQYKILQSRQLARRTIGALDLWKHPGLNPPVQNRLTVMQLVRTGVRMARSVFVSPKQAVAPAPDEDVNQSGVIDRFLGGVTVVPVRNSRLVDVRYRSADPSFAALVANGISKAYIEQNLEFKFLASKEASDWLGQQLTEQRTQVERSEQALQRYREQTESVSLEDRQNIVVQKLADLNAAVTKAKTERLQKEAAYNQIKAVEHDRNAIDTIPAILSNIFIQQQKAELADLQRQQAQLSEKLGPNHPDMVKVTMAVRTADAKVQGEIAKVVQAMRNDYQAAFTQEHSLMAALDQQKLDALALNRKGIDYGVLQRDAATNRQIFDSLLQRTKETGISGELKTSNIRVVDPAEKPRAPVSPNTPNNLLLGFVAGIAIALALTFFIEYLDNRIKTPAEIQEHLRLPFLGIVPALFGKHAKNPLINNGVPPGFSESFRTVRTNVLFSSAELGARSLVITSTGPGEGKTVVSGNLAIALAQAGQRVLLMDGDMRKPRLHDSFTMDVAPGLSNVLVGTSTASEAVRRSDIPELWVLPAGLTPPNPAELLGSKRFRDFLASLAPHFDWILIDTPPVMAVTDSSIVAHLVSGVIFVVGAEMTSREGAERAVQQLDQARAKFVGAVLNKVDLKHQPYYYSQYYRREYAEYYRPDTTDVVVEQA